MQSICTDCANTGYKLPGAAHDFEFAEVGSFAKAGEIGQIAAVFDDRNAGVGDPNPIDTIHMHTEGISHEDFDDDIVGRDEDGLIGVGLDEALFEVKHPFEDIAEAFATRHM